MPRPDLKDEQTILQNLWILGATAHDGATVPCGDAASARRLRFALYNAVKQFKGENAKPCSDQLKQAISSCALSFTDDGKGLIIRQKIATKLNRSVLDVLKNFTIQTDEERQAVESSERIMSKLLNETQEPQTELSSQASMYGARSR
jgi:hypothetical protein